MTPSAPEGAFENPRQTLARYGVRPQKSWSQNFLASPKVCAAIAAEAQSLGGPIVELGAGLGTLTAVLAATGGRVTAIEPEAGMLAVLRARFAGHPGVEIRAADALTVNLAELGVGPCPAVVGNLPYGISGPLLFRLFEWWPEIAGFCVMVQQEVGQRVLAGPGSRTYGVLSVLLGHRYGLKRVARVPAGAFVPVPRVDSVVIAGRPRAWAGAQPDGEVLRRLVSHAFARRRKQLRNALEGFEGWAAEALCEGMVADLSVRPETLAPEVFAALALRAGG